MGPRDISRMARINGAGHPRSLIDSIMMPDVITALTDWIAASGGAGVLIGGLALSFHSRPRMTQDIELLISSEKEIPGGLSGFERIGPTTFLHAATGVELQLFTPEALRAPAEIAERVIETALFDSGINIGWESGLVVLKLFRLSFQDQADIVALVKTAGSICPASRWLRTSTSFNSSGMARTCRSFWPTRTSGMGVERTVSLAGGVLGA